MTSYVGKYSQKPPQVCASIINNMISSFSRTAKMRAKNDDVIIYDLTFTKIFLQMLLQLIKENFYANLSNVSTIYVIL